MVEKILQSIRKIPAFPAAVQKVSELLRDEDYSTQDVVKVIQYDQAITANIMKMSNSAYFGSRQKIRTIHEAVVFLGRRHLQSAVLTAGASRFFQASRGGYVEKGKQLWEHSVAVAVMSQILSRQLRRREDPVLYTAALMHDIGKLILGEFVHGEYEKIEDLMRQRSCSFLDAEEEILGINHAELGGRIADQWNFPPPIRDGIAYHHRPDLLADEDSIAGLIYLSDQFCLMAGIDGGVDGLAHRGLGSIVKQFQLREVDLERNLILLLDELDKAADLLQLVH